MLISHITRLVWKFTILLYLIILWKAVQSTDFRGNLLSTTNTVCRTVPPSQFVPGKAVNPKTVLFTT